MLTYCWLEFLYYILFKRGINSRACSCAWVLTLNICASGHSAATGWPSGVQFSQLSCPLERDKWMARIIQVRSPGVKNWLFSHATTFVLPGHLWTFILEVFTFDLVLQYVYSCASLYASQMQTPMMVPGTHSNPFAGRQVCKTDRPKHLSERQNCRSCLFARHYKFKTEVRLLISWPWASYIISVGLSFLSCEVEPIRVPLLEVDPVR
jgi:hypothetical protein